VKDFVESKAMFDEAEHFHRKTDTVAPRKWERIATCERSRSMTVFPPTCAELVPPAALSVSLSIKIFLFDSGALRWRLFWLHLLNFVPGRGLRYARLVRRSALQVVDRPSRRMVRTRLVKDLGAQK